MIEGSPNGMMVVAAGEFGRTPRLVNRDGLIGRDHWPGAQAALISGGGLRMGQVVGATNSKGEYPADRALTPQDLLATMYRHLGVDYGRPFVDLAGRPTQILAARPTDPRAGLTALGESISATVCIPWGSSAIGPRDDTSKAFL